MGWLWSNSTASSSPNPSSQEVNTSQPPQFVPDTPEPPPQPPSKSLSRDELADQELQSFLRELNASEPQSTSKPFTRRPKPASSSTPTSDQNAPSDEPLSEQLLPTTMSCRTAFDQAFYCNSLGGRFNDLYRYGTLRSCSDDWGDFWFCMRTRGFGGKSKEDAIKEHYRQKERSKYAKDLGKESSEDVWKTREVMVERGR